MKGSIEKVRQQVLQRPDRSGEALEVEAQRGVDRRNVNRSLSKDGTGVDPGFHQVPGDSVRALLVVDCPRGGMQTGIPGQEGIVVVDSGDPCGLDHRRGQDDEIEDAEEIVGRDPTHPTGRIVTVTPELGPDGLRPPSHRCVTGEHPLNE
ncbi:MAG: hypothetical protein NTZ03_06510 [Actinobacteria bacterium]|nr:hypothetical protein [Actinomycetota bacterium]